MFIYNNPSPSFLISEFHIVFVFLETISTISNESKWFWFSYSCNKYSILFVCFLQFSPPIYHRYGMRNLFVPSASLVCCYYPVLYFGWYVVIIYHASIVFCLEDTNQVWLYKSFDINERFSAQENGDLHCSFFSTKKIDYT